MRLVAPRASTARDVQIAVAVFAGGLLLVTVSDRLNVLGLAARTSRALLVGPLALACAGLALRRVAPLTGLGLGLGALAADFALGGSLATILVFTQVLYEVCIHGPAWLWRWALRVSIGLTVAATIIAPLARARRPARRRLHRAARGRHLAGPGRTADRGDSRMTATVVVADDQEAVRAGLVLILNAAPDVAVIGEAADGEEAVALCRALRPDVALLDVRMPRRDGIWTPASPPALDTLTPREREVLACLGAGLSNVETADRLGMAESTTKTHVSRILTKLGLCSRV